MHNAHNARCKHTVLIPLILVLFAQQAFGLDANDTGLCTLLFFDCHVFCSFCERNTACADNVRLFICFVLIVVCCEDKNTPKAKNTIVLVCFLCLMSIAVGSHACVSVSVVLSFSLCAWVFIAQINKQVVIIQSNWATSTIIVTLSRRNWAGDTSQLFGLALICMLFVSLVVSAFVFVSVFISIIGHCLLIILWNWLRWKFKRANANSSRPLRYAQQQNTANTDDTPEWTQDEIVLLDQAKGNDFVVSLLDHFIIEGVNGQRNWLFCCVLFVFVCVRALCHLCV